MNVPWPAATVFWLLLAAGAFFIVLLYLFARKQGVPAKRASVRPDGTFSLRYSIVHATVIVSVLLFLLSAVATVFTYLNGLHFTSALLCQVTLIAGWVALEKLRVRITVSPAGLEMRYLMQTPRHLPWADLKEIDHRTKQGLKLIGRGGEEVVVSSDMIGWPDLLETLEEHLPGAAHDEVLAPVQEVHSRPLGA